MSSPAQHVSNEDVLINPLHQLLTLRTGLGWVVVGYILSLIGVATLITMLGRAVAILLAAETRSMSLQEAAAL